MQFSYTSLLAPAQAGRKRLPLLISALLVFALLSMFLSPNAYAQEGRIEISKDHTDGFFIETASGTPEIKVHNGIDNKEYDPDSVLFVIDKSTYANDYNFPDLTRTGSEGYFTASWDADEYFEPGWSAPGFTENGFASIRIEFLKVTGPAPFALFGNDPLGQEAEDIAPYLSDDAYYVEAGAQLPITGHTHAHWFFEMPGEYSMTVQAVGVKANGEEVRSQPVTEMFRVDRHPSDTRPDRDPVDLGVAPAQPSPVGEPDSDVSSSQPDSKPSVTEEPNAAGAPDTAEEADAPEETDAAEETDPAEEPSVTEKPSVAEDSDSPATSTNHSTLVLDHGHIDLFNVSAQGGKLQLAAKDDTGGKPILRAPESFKLAIAESAYIDVPKKLAAQLAPNGYFLSENGEQQQELPFPGWDTSAVQPNFQAIDIEFENVSGPGSIYMFSNPPFKGLVSPLTSGKFELTSGSVIHQASPSHVHTNWLFTAPGTYTMRVKASGTPASGTSRVESNTATYTIVVGNVADGQADGQAQGQADGNNGSPSGDPSTSGTSDTSVTSASTLLGAAVTAPQGQPNTAQSSSAPQTAPQAGSQSQEQCTWVETSDELALTPKIKDDRQSPPAWVMPESLQFAIGERGKATTNQALGSIPTGSEVWMISSAQVAGVPWLGLNTQHESLREHAKGASTVSLTSFSGPGAMEVFTSGNLGQAVGTHWFAGANNQGSGSASIPANTHVHPNWVFTKPGTYKVGLTMSVTLTSGKRISGETRLTFNVGSSSGVTEGHFDLGPTLGKAGAWKTPSGEPCTPNTHGSGSLSKTGSHMPEILALMIASFSLGVYAVYVRRRRGVRA